MALSRSAVNALQLSALFAAAARDAAAQPINPTFASKIEIYHVNPSKLPSPSRIHLFAGCPAGSGLNSGSRNTSSPPARAATAACQPAPEQRSRSSRSSAQDERSRSSAAGAVQPEQRTGRNRLPPGQLLNSRCAVAQARSAPRRSR